MSFLTFVNDISDIYVITLRYAGGLKKLDLRSGSHSIDIHLFLGLRIKIIYILIDCDYNRIFVIYFIFYFKTTVIYFALRKIELYYQFEVEKACVQNACFVQLGHFPSAE